jgi:hypothetical protein
MKKSLAVFLALSMICFCSTLAFAADTSTGGTVTLTDPTGDGPSLSVDIAAGTYMSYTAATTAGGYSGATGQIMSVVTGSSKADKDNALYFGVRSSQDPVDTDDNQVYQISAGGTAVNVAQCTTYGSGNFTAWHIRGGE